MHSVRLVFVLSLALVWLVPTIANAGVNNWTNISPPAGDVEQIVFDPVAPQVVYAILSGRLYTSGDGGQNWRPLESLSTPQNIRTIAADPSKSGTLYAGSMEGGITRSTDAGVTWRFLGLSTETVIFVAVHPEKPRMLYAVGSSHIHRSTDQGMSWRAVSERGGAEMLAFNPANPSVIYAGGFLKSTDEGATWHRIGSGYSYVAVHPQRPGLLVGWADRAVGTSTDEGYSWTDHFAPVVPWIRTLVWSVSDANSLYIGTFYYDGLYRSTDLGETWAPSNGGLTSYDVSYLVEQPGNPGRIFAGTGGSGFFISDDSGATWTPSNKGIRQAWVTGLAVNGENGTVCVGTSTAGFFRSSDFGQTWQQINQGLPMTRVREMTIDPLNPDVLFALLDDDLYRSTNGGDRWEAQAPLFDQGLTVLLPVPDPQKPGRWYVTGHYSVGEGPDDHFLFVTNDRGEKWQRTSEPLPAGAGPLAISPHDGRRYLLSSEGLFVAQSPFFQWRLSSPLVLTNLVFDPVDAKKIFGVSESGELWGSIDRGGTWSRIELGGGISDLAYSNSTSGPALYALGEEGLHHSDDSGSTWRLIARWPGSGSPYRFGGSIEVDPSRPDRVYAALGYNGGFFVLEHAASLFIPRLVSNPKETTGLALSNRGDREATLSVIAYDQSGNPIKGSTITNPIQVTLKPGEQQAMLASDWFGAGLQSRDVDGWIRIDGASRTITGFASALSADLELLETVPASHLTSQTWLFPEIDSKRTELRLANPGAETTSVIFELRDEQGGLKQRTSRSIPSGGVLSATAEMLFGSEVLAEDSIWVESDQPVMGLEYETDGKSYAKALLSLDADQAAGALVVPQYAVREDVLTSVTLVNLDPVPGTVYVRVYGDDGVPAGRERQVTIGARGKARINDPGFLGIDPAQPFSGYMKILSPNVRVTGTVSFADPSQQHYAAALPLVHGGATELVFSHLVSTTDSFTGVAILNTGIEEAALTMSVYRPDGELLAEKQLRLQPGTRRSSLLVDYFPELVGTTLSAGTIQITSDRDIAAFALFGRNDLRFLSTIAAQVLR